MIITDRKYNFSIQLKENQVSILTIENTDVFSHVIEDLTSQINGGEGSLILADKEKLLELSKYADLIMNPFEINCNDKRILNVLYGELKQNIINDFYKDFNILNSEISTFIERVSNSIPYPICYKDNLDSLGLLKYSELRIDDNYECLLERVINYLRVQKEICGIQIVVFINLKDYFSSDETQELYEFCFNKKIHIIIVEGHPHNVLESEQVLVIDKDLCYINI